MTQDLCLVSEGNTSIYSKPSGLSIESEIYCMLAFREATSTCHLPPATCLGTKSSITTISSLTAFLHVKSSSRGLVVSHERGECGQPWALASRLTLYSDRCIAYSQSHSGIQCDTNHVMSPVAVNICATKYATCQCVSYMQYIQYAIQPGLDAQPEAFAIHHFMVLPGLGPAASIHTKGKRVTALSLLRLQ
ncbi:hypothetical protein CIB48_g6393 [Xylaria polymorpha]|nr:hypothetical protein CIB48_g6393 [Xylaria polymorpha]